MYMEQVQALSADEIALLNQYIDSPSMLNPDTMNWIRHELFNEQSAMRVAYYQLIREKGLMPS